MTTSYEADRRWQAAHADWTRDTGDDETATGAFLRRVRAITEMHAIESRQEAIARREGQAPTPPEPVEATS